MSNFLFGARGCVRDDYGNWIFDYSKLCGLDSSQQEEIWASIIGLTLVYEQQSNWKINIESVTSNWHPSKL